MEKYERPVMEVERFQADVITSSLTPSCPTETPMIPIFGVSDEDQPDF